MNKKTLFVAIGSLCLAALGATVVAKPWYSGKYVGEENAAVLEVSRNGTPGAELLVLEGQTATAQFAPGGPVLGFRVTNVGLRGDDVDVAVYQMDGLDGAATRPSQLLEHVALTKGEAALAAPEAARWAGGGTIGLRLVDVQLAAR